MADNQEGIPAEPQAEPQVEETLEERIQQAEAMPTSEEEPEQDTVEEPTQTSEEEALANSKNPERTAEYIQTLQKKVGDLERMVQAQDVRPSAKAFDNLNQRQVDEVKNSFIDEDGNVDVNGLNQALNQANERATRAEQLAQSVYDRTQQSDNQREADEAVAKYPQLSPQDPNHDPRFEELVLNSWAAAAGNKTYREVADSISEVYAPKNEKKIREEAINEYKATQAKNQQGPIESGRGQVRVTQNDITALKERARSGDNDAIARLMELTDPS